MSKSRVNSNLIRIEVSDSGNHNGVKMPDSNYVLQLPEGIGQRVDSLVQDQAQVDFAADVSAVRHYLLEQPTAAGIPVTRDGRPIGWIGLRDVMDSGSGSHRIVSDVMSCGCTTILGSRTVGELELMLRNGSLDIGHSGLVVVDDDGRYLGWLDHRSLLRIIVTCKEGLPQYGATGLPGHPSLVEHTRRMLKERRLFVVASMNIRGFNAFNDHYGYTRGDQVLGFVAGLLQEHVDSSLDFVAYTGADNFTVLFNSMDWFERCEAMLQQCEAQSPRFYEAEDRRKGGLEQFAVTGKRVFTPMFSLAIGITQVEPGKFQDHHTLLRAAKDVKSRAGMTYGGAIFVEGMTELSAGGIAGTVQH